ncbi:MAG: hypothetical protein ACRC9Q_10205 [Bacteroidales bacterium]
MNIKKITLLMLLYAGINLQAQNEQYLVSGCGMNKVAVINRSGDVTWEYDLSQIKHVECNDAEITRQGNILFAYKSGARLIDKQKNIIWDHSADFPREEMFTATQLKNGNYLLACTGNPARILELNKKGELILEIKYDTGIKDPHGQFRQVTKSPSGTYLIPIMGKGVIHEVSKEGVLLREVKAEGSPFQLSLLKNGNWLVACGESHSLVEIDPTKNEVVSRIGENDIASCKLQFVAESKRLKNGNTLISNWNGHDAKDKTQPVVIEIDNNKNLVWKLAPMKDLDKISTIFPITKKF